MMEELQQVRQELEETKELLVLYSKIIRHSFLADKLGDTYFISGEMGSKDENGLPEKLLICPAYGVDWVQIYERTDKATGPEW